MAHARHRAPSRRTEFSRGRLPSRHRATPRATRLPSLRMQPVLGLTGTAAVTLAVVGAILTPSAATPQPTALGTALALSTSEAAVEADELKALRQDALEQASRSVDRLAMDVAPPRTVLVAVPDEPAPLPATTTAYATQSVNVRAGAAKESELIASLEFGAEVAVTGRTEADYAEVVFDGRLAWVYASYVSSKPPSAQSAPSDGRGVSGAPCGSGSAVESGLTSNAISVHRAVCALFPGVSSYGGVRRGDGGDHGSGHALDIMVSTEVGNQVAAYLQAHAGELGISYLIWRQRFWSVERSGEGWRWMEDRGSYTANHYDHVHVSVY